MSRLKKGLVKRVMAVILSGAMIVSNMTAFASETSEDTGGGTVTRKVQASVQRSLQKKLVRKSIPMRRKSKRSL